MKMNGIYNYFTDIFSRKTNSNVISLDEFQPNYLKDLSILMEESRNASKYSWEKEGEEVCIHLF